ncbi:MAG: Holliday junction resolvase RuvX [Firmicutes bacterium]|nr:Holliday junction resolvase RuvX [Bacillota bacterium]
MRWMGLDVGQRRIGIALSDPLELFAQGYGVLERSASLNQDFQELNEIISQETVEGIVVGLPRNMDGTEGVMAEKVRGFSKKMEERFGLPLFFWDERLSTVAAERVLLEADLSRKKRKQKIDKVAAVFILQNFLDSRNKS